MTVDVVKVWAAQAVVRVAELARAGCRFVTRRHFTGTDR